MLNSIFVRRMKSNLSPSFRLLFLLVCNYFLLRLIFIVANYKLLNIASAGDISTIFLSGFRFDLAAIAFTNGIFFLIFNLPLDFKSRPIKNLISILYIFINLFFILLNLIDTGYYPFTQKRLTADFFEMATMGDDFVNMIPSLIRDYWILLLLFVVFVILNFKLIKGITGRLQKISGRTSFISTIIVVALLIFFGRGGLQYKPINILSAAPYTSAQNVGAVLNSTFTIIKTAGKDDLQEIELSIPDPQSYFNPVKNFANDTLAFKPMNVVIIIMESFGKEYTGYFNQGHGYTPFLDSLMQEGLICTDAYANGKKSIEGIPAVVSGIPALMTSPYISGSYNGNKLLSIASLLKTHGYISSFFHGGNNGTMGFENFTKMAGYDKYIGRKEYGTDDYDGTWGVYDQPFFRYFCHEMNNMKQPFLTTFFSLSSHHPYSVPDSLQNRFKGGDQPVYKSVEYADYSLKEFFSMAKTQPWYKNTVFVITADHTGPSFNSKYQSRTGIYEIPVLYFIPSDSTIKGIYSYTTQQTDIVPSVLDYLHYPEKFKIFGNSIFRKSDSKWAINYLDGMYQLITPKATVRTDLVNDTEYIARDGHTPDSTMLMNRLKVIVSDYNNSMIKNKLTDVE